MNIKSVLFLLLMLGSTLIKAQEDCMCPMIYEPVCAVDSSGVYAEFPNTCFAECFGFSVVEDSTLCNIIVDGDCGCEVTDSTFICAEDSLGNVFPVPNQCFADCWGLTVVEGQDCFENPWDDCICPQVYDPVCAVDSTGVYVEFPNACYAECFGYTVVEDSTLCDFIGGGDCNCEVTDSTYICAQDSFGNIYPVPNECFAACWGLLVVEGQDCFDDPWGDCNCPEIYDPVCAVDSSGNYVEFHNQCYAECFGYSVVDDSLCNVGGWYDCECEFDENEPFICAVDSLGHPCYVPNACFAACWGLTVTDDSLCNVIEIDPEIDIEILNCIDSLNMDENTTFQEALLMLSESCGMELPECISEAPLFENDSLFIAYIVQHCEGDFGFNGNTQGSNVMNLYNHFNAESTSGTDDVTNNGLEVSLISNPVTGRIEYKINSSKGGKTEISLMNISGQKFVQQSVLLNEGVHNYSIEVTGFKPGMYILSVADRETVKNCKVIIAE
jgi:hypothetical protein